MARKNRSRIMGPEKHTHSEIKRSRSSYSERRRKIASSSPGRGDKALKYRKPRSSNNPDRRYELNAWLARSLSVVQVIEENGKSKRMLLAARCTITAQKSVRGSHWYTWWDDAHLPMIQDRDIQGERKWYFELGLSKKFELGFFQIHRTECR